MTENFAVSAFGEELTADTEAGAEMVAAAERFADEFAAGALVHDRDGSFAVEHLEKLRADRFLVASIPTELGGGGVTSLHDVLVAMSRLARTDPATTIGVNMHFAVIANLVRGWNIAVARGDDRRAKAMGGQLRAIVAADVVFATAASEPSPQDLTRPRTTAVRSDAGWTIEGRKAFATMAPAATIINVAVTFVDSEGSERYGFALVPANHPGVVFHDDWDALGMRASASGSVSFDDVQIDHAALRDGFAAGRYSAPFLERYTASGAFHTAAALGIAEAAHAKATTSLARRRDTVVHDPHAVTELAGSVVDLTAARASFDRAARAIDQYATDHATGETTLHDAQRLFTEVQASKAFVSTAALRVVDRALALSGGSGYLATNPLAKAWRDVRAIGFMHPVGANRVQDLLARTALGIEFDDGQS
jgi:alkylation response protein AidB-like acyl-CoA dehydrogenase